MLELTLAKHGQDVRSEAAPARLPEAWLTNWLLRMWGSAVRHAERPGRYVPYC